MPGRFETLNLGRPGRKRAGRGGDVADLAPSAAVTDGVVLGLYCLNDAGRLCCRPTGSSTPRRLTGRVDRADELVRRDCLALTCRLVDDTEVREANSKDD